MGMAAGLVSDTVLSITTLVGIVTIAVSAYMILYTDQIYVLCRRVGLLRIFGASEEQEPEPDEDRRGHVIVVGMNALGQEIVRKLVSRGEHVLAIDTDPEKLEGLEGAETVIGNVEYESVLEEIGMRRTRGW